MMVESAVRPPRDPVQFDYIYYAGEWTLEEQELVASAVKEVEDLHRFRTEEILGKPWVCMRQTLSDRRLYTAYRMKLHRKVLTATSAEELAERIRKPM